MRNILFIVSVSLTSLLQAHVSRESLAELARKGSEFSLVPFIWGQVGTKYEGLPAYGLTVSPHSEDVLFRCYMVRSDGLLSDIGDCWVGKDGYLRGYPNPSPIIVYLNNFAPGETAKIFLLDDDQKQCASVSIVPYPIEESANGYTVYIEPKEKTGVVFVCHAWGFDPNEEIWISSESGDETIVSSAFAEANGTFECMLMPAVIGLDGGTEVWTIKGNNGTISISFPWGNEFVKWAESIHEKEYSLLKKRHSQHARGQR